MEWEISFSVNPGFLNIDFLVTMLLPITIFEMPDNLANSAI